MTVLAMSKTHGMFALKEIAALTKAVRSLPKQPVVIILGAGPGTATITTLQARPDVRVFTVDIISATGERNHAKRMGFLPRLQQIKGRTKDVGKNWKGPMCNLLFVDACHTYKCVKADNRIWLPFLKPGGIAWYHDYGTTNGMWMQVKTAVDEDMKGQKRIVRANSSIAFRWNPNANSTE